MTVESLMTQAVTVRHLIDVDDQARNQIGEATPSYTEEATTMYLEPSRGGSGSSFVAGMEVGANRNTPIGDWLGIGRSSIAWEASDQIVYGTHVLDVVAPPRSFFDPLTQLVSHVELSLQEIT